MLMQHLHRICIQECLYLYCFMLFGLTQNHHIQENNNSYYYNNRFKHHNFLL